MVCLRSVSSLGLGVALLSPTASVAGVASASCKHEGYQYVEGNKLANIPLGGFFTNPDSCQQSCSANVFCEQWTWKQDGFQSTVRIGSGGCWIFSANATLEKVNPAETSGRVTSGPKTCPPPATDNSTAPPDSTAPPASTSVTTGVPIIIDEPPTNVTPPVNGTDTEGEASGGSFPLWILAVVAVLAGVGGLLAYVLGGKKEGKSKGKKKKSSRASKLPRQSEPEAPPAQAEEAAPLMQEQAQSPPPAAAPAATVPQQFPGLQAPQMGTMGQGYPASMPAGVQYMQPQPGAFQMASINPYMQAGARQPQFASMP